MRFINLFSDYMEDDSSIITLNEIDDFLQDDKNEEIVKKELQALALFIWNINPNI